MLTRASDRHPCGCAAAPAPVKTPISSMSRSLLAPIGAPGMHCLPLPSDELVTRLTCACMLHGHRDKDPDSSVAPSSRRASAGHHLPGARPGCCHSRYHHPPRAAVAVAVTT